MGVFFLIATPLVIALALTATIFGYRLARKRGWSNSRRWLAAALGLAIVVLPVFWDWLPTIWLHAYYCDKYAGLTVIKTPDQWKSENPGVATTLVRQTPPLQVGRAPRYYFQLNQRFRWEIETIDRPLGIMQHENRVVDSQTGTSVVTLVDFSTGQSNNAHGLRDLKFWMSRDSCPLEEGKEGRGKTFGQLKAKFGNLGS